MGKLFGTDGVRGIAGKDLNAGFAYHLGLAASEVLIDATNHKPKILIGKDTRISGDMFESAIAAGLCAMGSDVVLLGVVPTPAVAYLVNYAGADAGIMISASHNPSEYNGIKIFNNNGYKLSDELENKIEAILFNNIELKLSSGDKIGRISQDTSLVNVYKAHVRSILEGCPTRKILIDLANGSACATAKEIFQADFMADCPNGLNINDHCGSTSMEKLGEEVRKGGYDFGIAFDGDADRCLITDENGTVINGDCMIALFAQEMKKQNQLEKDTVVVTSMSNLGFHKMAKNHHFHVKVTDVGDRFVLEAMLEHGYNLGGEQSGHIILTDYATTGDGQTTAAKMIAIAAHYPNKKISEICNCMKIFPQVTINVPVSTEYKQKIAQIPEIQEKVSQIQDLLADTGRIILRPSGTEALIRIMLEGEEESQLQKMGEELAKLIREKE